MPELPEVEVIRCGLIPHLSGRVIATATVNHPRSVRRHLGGAADFCAAVAGRRLDQPRRRGKYLWFPLDDDSAILAHLGMSGQFRIDDAAKDHPHTRIRFSFDDDGPQVSFVDQRTFGGLSVSPNGAELPPEIAHIGLDPFDPQWDLAIAVAKLRGSQRGIKRVLLDQTVVSGIGNIYADEALWQAQIHPETPVAELSDHQLTAVLSFAQQVMRAALAAGGTSFDSQYVNTDGASGYFARELSAYGRTDQPCARCGHPIIKESFMNRSSHRCSRCQPPPRGKTKAAPNPTKVRPS